MNSATYPAAQFCEALTIGGYSDWYLPAMNEVEVCYFNLKPYTTNNSPTSGINANAVPARASNYTSGNPAQTAAAAFITGTGAEAFLGSSYWTSTEKTARYGRVQSFYQGTQTYSYKDFSFYFRAIRRVAV
jgi:hypothetical protein